MKSAREKIVKAAGLLLVLQVVSQLLAMLKQVLIAAHFGTSDAMDSYLVAVSIVGLVALWFRLPIRQTLIPMFRYDLTLSGERKAWTNFSILFNDLAVVMLTVAVAGGFLAPYFVSLIAPGFDAEKTALAAVLAQITMAIVVFTGLGAVLSQAFMSYERFFLPGIKEGLGNIVMILALLILSSTYGIYGLAVAAVLGGLTELVSQFPILWEKRKLYSGKVDLRHDGVIEMGKLGFPLLISTGGTEVARITDRVFASLLAAGSLSALAFAQALVIKPFELMIRPLYRATHPHFTQLSAKQDFKTLSRQLFRYIRLVSFFTVPAAIGIMALSEVLVRAVYQRGAFDEASVQLTSQAVLFYAIGLPASCIASVLNQTFFSLKDAWTPTKMALFRLGVKMVLTGVLIHPMAHLGIAVAESASHILRVAFLFVLLPEKVKRQEGWSTFKSVGQVLAASSVMGIVIHFSNEIFSGFSIPFELAALVLLGIVLYAMTSFLLRSAELASLLETVRASTAKYLAKAS
jgi:putative peptidoglycan lipid II flippase